MLFLAQVKNWFAVTLIRALLLKSDLRLYKFEKKIVATSKDVDEKDEKEVDNDDKDNDNKYIDDSDNDIKYKDNKDIDNKYKDKKDNDKIDNDERDESRKTFGFPFSSFQKLKTKINGGPSKLAILHDVVSEGTAENFAVKSAFGFLGGVILTYICFLFLIYSLNFTLRRATLICVGLGVVLSLGLAFSVRIRCTVLLCMPQLFSKRGRQALLAYAFILALSGPAKNTLHNVEVMSESLACGQEQLIKAENELLKCVHRPNTAVKQSLEKMLLKLDIAVKGYKNFIEKFYRECEAVMETIIRAQEWLYSIYCLCNEKMGSPYSRCANLLCEASQNCKGVSGAEEWQKACVVSSVQDLICPMRNDPICSVEDLPPFWPLLNHQKQLNDFRREALNQIQVKIETHEIFSQPNRTATFHEEYQGMATEIRQKTDQFLQYFDVMSVIFGIFILVLFIKVLIYRYKFLTEDEYDNRFITSDFVDIDRTRAEFGMQTLLPLEPRERKKFIRVTSMRMVPYERKRVVSSFVFLVFATFKIVIHMLTDGALYWMLSTMRRHGRMLLISSDGDVPQITVTVSGEGLFADLFRNITKTVRPYAVQQILDPIPCLPDPIPPDWNRYLQILTLVLICWFLAFCEPYGLRLRHIVMVIYHPERARERAIWLYNRILTTRINFVKFARRQLRRRYKDLDEETFYGCRFWFWKRPLKCLLCKLDLKNVEHIKCPTDGCVGIYCRPCFETLQLCSICKDPSYYGDYSDVSEEKDSEDEERIPYSSYSFHHSDDQTYQRRASIEKTRTFQMYDPVPYARNWTYPKFQISMDTIIDLDEAYPRQSDERPPDEDKNFPFQSPSILTRLAHQWRRAFGRSIPEGKQTPTQGRHELASGSDGTWRKPSRKTSQTRRKQLFSAKSLKGFRIFRWKLKDRISDESFRENSSEFQERFKNVYFVDLDLKRMNRAMERKKSSSGSESLFPSLQEEWKESVVNLTKLLSRSSLPLPTCPRRTATKDSDDRKRPAVDVSCPVHGSRSFRRGSSKKGRKKRFQSDSESSGDYQHTGLINKDSDSGGLSQQVSRPSLYRRVIRRGKRRQRKSRESLRRKRRCVRYETTSESSQEGSSYGRLPESDAYVQKVLAKKVDTMREKLAKFFRRNARESWSEDGSAADVDDFRSDEELNCDRRKVIRPDLLSDLPSSKTSTYAGYCGDSDEYEKNG